VSSLQSESARNLEEATCLQCGQRFPVRIRVRRGKARRPRTCGSRRCLNAARRPRAWNDLQQRCLEQLVAQGLSFAAWARDVGIERETLRKWFQKRDSALSTRFLQRLADVLGISIEQALREAGGLTAEDKHRAVGVQIGTQNLVQSIEDPKARRVVYEKSARSRQGLIPSTDALAKGVQTRWATGVYGRTLTRLQEVNGSKKAALVRGLGKRLGRTPTPSRELISEWAADTSERVGLAQSAVLAIWSPYLRRLGLVHAGGRGREEERCSRVRALMATWPRTRKGLADGFWNEAARREDMDYDSLKWWWKKHRPICQQYLAELGRGKNSRILG